MEGSKKDESANKLICALKKITEFKKFDNIFIDKFLVNINREFLSRDDNILLKPDLLEWLSETLQRWKQIYPTDAEAVFVCKFIGIIAQYEKGFSLLQNDNVLNELISILQSKAFGENALKPVYINLLSLALNHNLGYEWIKTAKQWKVVSNLYLLNTNLYVEREGLNFLKKFIIKASLDNELSYTILQEIFSPLRNFEKTITDDKTTSLVVLLLLKLLRTILKMNISNENSSFYVQFVKIYDLQAFLDFLLENCQQEIILDEVSTLKVLLFIVQCADKKEFLFQGDIPVVAETFYAMLKQYQFNGVIKLAKHCQVLWSEIRKEIQYENKTGVPFITIQLLPALICIKPPDTALYDIYTQKLFSLTTLSIQKFFYSFRDDIRSQEVTRQKNLALKGILSVITNIEYLNLEEAELIFQAMTYILKSFIPENNCRAEYFNFFNSEKKTLLCTEDTSLLSAVLNALCTFIEKFKINWTESLEISDFCILLENLDLASTIVVQMLLFVKLAIINFMPSDLTSLPKNAKDSCFDCLMPLLYKHLQDPHWDIRDSCLEVVTAIAELSGSRYPALQQLLIYKNLYSLVLDIMEGDSESYVRASAIQALAAMTKVEFLNQLLHEIGFPNKIIKLVENESEGIVRREAALAIKQIYLSLSDQQDDILKSFYEVTGYLAICDLHWEVKVNALVFWEAVIQRTIADQGIKDGSFLKTTFSKEHKKIVDQTEDEVKLGLGKVLKKLSEIGCLYVLLSTLNDDCDMPVIEKSAQILADLLSTLKYYNVMEPIKDFPVCDKIPMKRKVVEVDNFEKKKSSISSSGLQNNSNLSGESLESHVNVSTCSDVVIDRIVNEMDINLLINVCYRKEKTPDLKKNILLQEVKLDGFLSKMQNFELEKFLEDKQKWLENVEVDFRSFTNESCLANMTEEKNMMDCY